MPPRATRNSSRNPVNSPLKSPKTLKKNAKEDKETPGTPLKNSTTSERKSPLKKAPEGTPKKTPAKKALAKNGSAKNTPAKETPVKGAAKKTPVKNTPAKETPVKGSTKKTSAKNTPAKKDVKAPAKKVAKTPAKKEGKTVSNSLVPEKLIKSAVDELIKYHERKQAASEADSKKQSLFDEDDSETAASKSVDLVFQFKKFITDKQSLKLNMINLDHPLYSINDKDSDFKICLITRDDIIKTDAQLEKIEEAKLPFLSKILPFKALRNEYKTYELKRQLSQSYDLFIADQGIVASLPSVLGKPFYSKNKAPVPIRIAPHAKSNVKEFSIETVRNQINKVLSSTFFKESLTSNVTLNIGNIGTFTKDQLVSNAVSVISHFEKSRFNNGEDNAIRSAFIKLRSSPALPLFYDESLYLSKSDIAEEKKPKTETSKTVETEKEYVVGNKVVIAKGIKLSKFEQSLLELGQFDNEPNFVENKEKKAKLVKSKSEKKTSEIRKETETKQKRKSDVDQESEKKSNNKKPKTRKSKA